MRQYNVTGMSCAACSSRVEKAVSEVPGVNNCSVNLLTNSMSVDGDASDEIIIKAVEDAGYGASIKGKNVSANSEENITATDEMNLKNRLISSIVFLGILMYISMGHHMFGFPIPGWFHGNYVALGILQMLLAIMIMIINKRFFISGFKSVIHKAPNMDTLVALGSFASFAWSLYALFMMTDAQVNEGSDAAKMWLDELYFESAATILVLITVGKLLEAKSKGKTTDALKSLMKLAPKTATVLKDDKEVTVNIHDVLVNDIFIVKPGENIPVDGIILEGDTAVDESSLTGESIPVNKVQGDKVYTATNNQLGYIKCKALKVGEDTAYSKIIQMVSDASASKAPIAKIADKVSGVFVPAVVVISFTTLLVWLFIGKPFDYSLARAISVLVISCPCALGLATPVAIMVGNGVGARNGVLFKTAESLEETGKVNVIVFDKTGTITKGEPEVNVIIPFGKVTEEELLANAYSLEIKSEHPLAKAIVKEGELRGIRKIEILDFKVLPGNGLEGTAGEEKIIGGSFTYVSSKIAVGKEVKDKVGELALDGNTPILFAKGSEFLGMIGVRDNIKDDCKQAVNELNNMGISVVMLTGDNINTAKAIGDKAGISNVIAGVLPDGKESVIRQLKAIGKVAMVGDGINDAPALTVADIGIAIGTGTDVAIDAADVVLMNNRLCDVPATIRLSRVTLKNIKENLFWAFFYNVLCIPLAAGCYVGVMGIALNPMVGALAMSLSSFCVVMNALRLNLYDVHSATCDKRIKGESAENIINKINEKMEKEKMMTKTLNIEGMMCMHCEKHTKDALEAIDGVESVVASHVDKNAVITLSKEVDDAVLIEAVEKAGYKVVK